MCRWIRGKTGRKTKTHNPTPGIRIEKMCPSEEYGRAKHAQSVVNVPDIDAAIRVVLPETLASRVIPTASAAWVESKSRPIVQDSRRTRHYGVFQIVNTWSHTNVHMLQTTLLRKAEKVRAAPQHGGRDDRNRRRGVPFLNRPLRVAITDTHTVKRHAVND